MGSVELKELNELKNAVPRPHQNVRIGGIGALMRSGSCQASKLKFQPQDEKPTAAHHFCGMEGEALLTQAYSAGRSFAGSSLGRRTWEEPCSIGIVRLYA